MVDLIHQKVKVRRGFDNLYTHRFLIIYYTNPPTHRFDEDFNIPDVIMEI